MNPRVEHSTDWEKKFLSLGSPGGWGNKPNNISLKLLKSAGIQSHQYEYMYNKLNEWNTVRQRCNIKIWQVQLLSGKEGYFKKHADTVNKMNESLLLYAVWSGNLLLAKKYYAINPEDFYSTQDGWGIGFFAVCSQNSELLEWIKTIDSSQLKILHKDFSIAALSAHFGYINNILWLCNFDFNIVDSNSMFELLNDKNYLLFFVAYLHDNKMLSLLTDYKYLAYYAVKFDNIPLYKWISYNIPELLNQRIDPIDMHLLQFAAHAGSDEMFSLVFYNQNNLIEIKDKNDLGFMEYAFLRGPWRINYALGLSASGYCFTLNIPKGCEVNYTFGKFNKIHGNTMVGDFSRFSEMALNINYKIQAICPPKDKPLKDGLFSLLSQNKQILEQETQIATQLWLLLSAGMKSQNSLFFKFPKECLEIIFKNCFLENKKPQINYLTLFNKTPVIRNNMLDEILDDIPDNEKNQKMSKKRCTIC